MSDLEDDSCRSRSTYPAKCDGSTESYRSGSRNKYDCQHNSQHLSRPLVNYADLDNTQSGSSTNVTRSRYVSMADSSSFDYHEFEKGEFKPGTIIRAPIHEEDFKRTPRPLYSPSESRSSYKSGEISHVSHTDFGPVYSENRFFIVVEQYSNHYLAVPLFTYQGTGLRREHDAKEYASIEDHRYPGSSMKAAPYLLTTSEMQPTAKPMKPESVAHFTYPVSRKYNLHVSYQGRLQPEDTKLLVKLFKRRGSLK